MSKRSLVDFVLFLDAVADAADVLPRPSNFVVGFVVAVGFVVVVAVVIIFVPAGISAFDYKGLYGATNDSGRAPKGPDACLGAQRATERQDHDQGQISFSFL